MFKTCTDDVWICLKTNGGWRDYLKSINANCRNIKDKKVKLSQLSQSYLREKSWDREKVLWEAVRGDRDLQEEKQQP